MAGVDELAVQLAFISARLREAADGGLTRELTRQVGRAVEPVGPHIRAGLPDHVPDRYAGVIEPELQVTRSASYTGDEARVTVLARTTGRKRRRLRRLDDGILWHPLFGDRKRWYEQGAPSVQPGWFSGPVEESAPAVRKAVSDALTVVVEKIVHGGP